MYTEASVASNLVTRSVRGRGKAFYDVQHVATGLAAASDDDLKRFSARVVA